MFWPGNFVFGAVGPKSVAGLIDVVPAVAREEAQGFDGQCCFQPCHSLGGVIGSDLGTSSARRAHRSHHADAHNHLVVKGLQHGAVPRYHRLAENADECIVLDNKVFGQHLFPRSKADNPHQRRFEPLRIRMETFTIIPSSARRQRGRLHVD